MKTQILFKISLITSVVGIMLLLFLANTLQPKLISIEEINDKMLSKKVMVQGKIFKIENKKTFQILSIVDETGKIDVLCECENKGKNKNSNKEIKEFQKIEVIGRVQAYGKYLQINADKILEK